MAIYVTTAGFFGGFSVRPKRIVEFAADGQKRYSTPVRMALIRLGIDKGSKQSVGFFDTEKLPFRTEMACEEVYGADWKIKLVKEIDGLNMPLHKMLPGEAMPEIEGSGGPRIISGMRTIAATRSPSRNIPQSIPVPAVAAEPAPRAVKKVEK
jgi:hypothetical protein